MPELSEAAEVKGARLAIRQRIYAKPIESGQAQRARGHTWGAAWGRRGDRTPSVRRAVLPTEDVVHAQHALRARHVAVAVHMVCAAGACAVALRMILVRVSVCARRCAIQREAVGRRAAAQVVRLKLRAVRGRLRLAPALAHMRQDACSAFRSVHKVRACINAPACIVLQC